MSKVMQCPIEVFVKERELLKISPNPTFRVIRKLTGLFHRSNAGGKSNGEGNASKHPPTIESKQTNQTSSSPQQPLPIGACSFSHELLMLLSLKQQVLGESRLQFVVHRVHRAPPTLRKQALRFIPAIVDANTTFASDHFLDILQYIDKQYPTPQLMPKFPSPARMLGAEEACFEVFQKFYSFIKRQTEDSGKLEASLRMLDDFLAQSDDNESCELTYDTGNGKGSDDLGINNFDCEVLPLLHQIRIASEHVANYRIPDTFSAIWRYLGRGYRSKQFTDWCPSDQEIAFVWKIKQKLMLSLNCKSDCGNDVKKRYRLEEKIRLIRETPRYSFDVPYAEQE